MKKRLILVLLTVLVAGLACAAWLWIHRLDPLIRTFGGHEN